MSYASASAVKLLKATAPAYIHEAHSEGRRILQPSRLFKGWDWVIPRRGSGALKLVHPQHGAIYFCTHLKMGYTAISRPKQRLPLADQILSHYLMLEFSETLVASTANYVGWDQPARVKLRTPQWDSCREAVREVTSKMRDIKAARPGWR